MKILFTVLVLACVLCLAGCAQDAAPTAAPAQPQYTLAAGLGFNHYDTPQIKGWGTFGAQIADKTYSLTTLDMTSKAASMRTGILRIFYSANGWALGALADAGVAAGEGSIAGAFTAGGLITRDVSKFAHLEGAFVVGSVRIVQLGGGAGVSPTFSFGFGKAF